MRENEILPEIHPEILLEIHPEILLKIFPETLLEIKAEIPSKSERKFGTEVRLNLHCESLPTCALESSQMFSMKAQLKLAPPTKNTIRLRTQATPILYFDHGLW